MKKQNKFKKLLLISVMAVCSSQAMAQFGGMAWSTQDADAIKALTGISDQLNIVMEQNSKVARYQEGNAHSTNMAIALSNVKERQAKVVWESVPDLNKCRIATAQMGAAAGEKYALQTSASLQDSLNESLYTSQSKRPNSATNRKEKGTCTMLDVANAIGGCTNADVDSTYAGLSENGASLNLNMETKSLTLNDKQVETGKQFIAQMLDHLPDLASGGKDNRDYTMKANQIRQITSTAQGTLNKILANHSPLPIAPNSSEAKTFFNQMSRTDYKNFFGTEMPTQPSTMERLRFTSFQDAYGTRAPTALTGSETEILREIRELQAKQNVLLYKTLEQQEETNKNLAMIANGISILTEATRPSTKNANTGI